MRHLTRTLVLASLSAAGLAACAPQSSTTAAPAGRPAAQSSAPSASQVPTPPPPPKGWHTADHVVLNGSNAGATPSPPPDSAPTLPTGAPAPTTHVPSVADQRFGEVVGEKLFPGQTLSAARKQQLHDIGRLTCAHLDAGQDMKTTLSSILKDKSAGLTRYQTGITAGAGIAAFCPEHVDDAKAFATQNGTPKN